MPILGCSSFAGWNHPTNGYYMKLSRIIATGAVLALIGGSSILTATTATAAPEPTTNYVSAASFTAETSPYANSWFKGDSTPPTTVADSLSGLVVTGQVLNGATPTTGLTALVGGAQLNVASGDAYFQVPLFANVGATGFTTLRPAAPGVLTGTWVTSRALLADDGTTAFPAGASATLAEFQQALGADYTILAYGAFVDPGTSATITSITWNGVTSQFTPRPTATASATSVSLSELTKGTGVTVKVTGFVPGESVQPGYGAGQSGDSFGDPIVADAAGAVTVTFILPDATVGDYNFGAFNNAGIGAFATVSVVADGTTVATPAAPISGNASFTG